MEQLAAPAGFETRPSGLIVPAGAVPLEDERWFPDEEKLIRRAFKLLDAKGLVAILGCRDPRCAEEPRVTMEDIPGGLALVCRHKRRRVVR